MKNRTVDDVIIVILTASIFVFFRVDRNMGGMDIKERGCGDDEEK